MIIFLYGPDEYRREQRRQELISGFITKHGGFGVVRIDLSEDGSASRLREFIRNQPIFSATRLAALAEVFAAETKEAKELLGACSTNTSVTALVSEREKPPKEFGFLLKKPTLHEEFDHLDGAEWNIFIAQEAKKRSVSLSADALAFLGTVYRHDSWRLVTELDKLSLLSGGTVAEGDLDRVGIEAAPSFWGLMNGLKSPRLSDRLLALEKCFVSNEPAGKLFNILAYQWPEKLEKFAAYDLAVKSGKLDYEEMLLDLIL